jgi:superfamily II DNA or RNA helicase
LKKIRYVGDLIQPQEIKTWQDGEIILINAPTGGGKNWFISKHLVAHCRVFGKKILLFSNRNPLKEQNQREIDKNGDNDIITTVNYQKLEDELLRKHEINHYDYIVGDECHYFFHDAMFNRTTDLTLKWLLEKESSIRIFLSATTQIMEEYLSDSNILIKKYEMKPDYSYIKNFYFYNSDEVLKKLLIELPEEDKLIYFASTTKALNISKGFKNTAFICSKNNKEYSKYINTEEMKNIVEYEKFDCQKLCTTSVLDNGINIKDSQVKHIVVDYFDLDTVQQSVGRFRRQQDEKINVYIRNRNKGSINGTKYINAMKLEQPEYFKLMGEKYFLRKYEKQNHSNMIDTVFEGEKPKLVLNQMMFWKHTHTSVICDKMMESKDGYIEEVIKRFHKKKSVIKILDDELDAITLEDKIDKLVDIKMFSDEREEFKNFLLRELFNTPKMSHGSLGLTSINALFCECGLNYKLISKIEKIRKSVNRDKTYWMILAS